MDLALNNLQWLIFHKTKPNQTIIATITLFSLPLSNLELFILLHRVLLKPILHLSNRSTIALPIFTTTTILIF